MRSNNPSSPMGVEIDIVSGNIFSESGKFIVVLQYIPDIYATLWYLKQIQ
jgi:hypothetical protein